MTSSGSDYNKDLNPLVQRFLLGVCIISGIGTAAVIFVLCLALYGVIPMEWLR